MAKIIHHIPCNPKRSRYQINSVMSDRSITLLDNLTQTHYVIDCENQSEFQALLVQNDVQWGYFMGNNLAQYLLNPKD